MKGPNRQISGERKALYYLGLVLVVIGFLVFFSVFVTAASGFFSPGPFGGPSAGIGSFALRGVIGMGLMIGGGFLMSVGSRGLAGSGVILDPERTRQDLEPWSRTAGGMVHDALDEADINLGRSREGAELSFDEKLRRLDRLRQEQLITEEEYQRKREEILNERW